MLQHIALIAALAHSPAPHAHAIERINASGYLYHDYGGDVVLTTNACTVTTPTAGHKLTARLERGGRRGSWLRFYDWRGEEEADCQVTAIKVRK